jgi:hypothetical protein
MFYRSRRSGGWIFVGVVGRCRSGDIDDITIADSFGAVSPLVRLLVL